MQQKLMEAQRALKKVTDQITAAQNADQEVDIATHVVAGELARKVVNLGIEYSRISGVPVD